MRALALVVAPRRRDHTRGAVQTRRGPARAVVDRMLTLGAAISGRACADVQVEEVETGAVMKTRAGRAFVNFLLAPDA